MTDTETTQSEALTRVSVVADAIARAEHIVESTDYDPEHRKARISGVAAILLVRWAQSDSRVRELIVPANTLEENARRLVHAVLG